MPNAGNIMWELSVPGMRDVPILCHLLKKEINHFGPYYLHDNCLYVLIICCVLKHSIWKRLNNRRAFPKKVLVTWAMLIRAPHQQSASLKPPSTSLAGHFTDVYIICLKGRNLSMCPTVYWTGVSTLLTLNASIMFGKLVNFSIRFLNGAEVMYLSIWQGQR